MPDIAPMTFAEMKEAAAADLREVAKLLNAKADEVAAGDMDAFYSTVADDFFKWLEMLAFRQSYRAERRELSDSARGEHGSGS